MSEINVVSGPGRRAVTVLMVLGLALSMAGCASKYGAQTVQVKYYSDCYAPIAQLRKDEATRTSNTVAGAIVGGLIGAAIGYNQDGARGAAIGGLSGAVIGGTAAYLITDEIQKKSQAERFAAYSASLNQDIQGMNNAVAAARLVNKCYEDSYKVLKQQYQAGRIGQEEMASRLNEMRNGTSDANNVLAKFAADIAENQVVYQDIQKSEARKGAGSAQLASLANQEKQVDLKQSELQLELQRMKSISATFDSDYKTIHAQSPSPRRPAVLHAAVCRPVKM